MSRPESRRQDRGVWFRRTLPRLPQLDDVIEVLEGLGRMLMEIDGKLEQIVEILEED